MTIQELMEQAKECCERPRTPCLNAKSRLDALNSNKTDSPKKSETFISRKDRDFNLFLSSVWTSRNIAYMRLKSARKPNPKRPPFAQAFYDRQTDEQIFASYFASRIKWDIEYHTSAEKNGWINILLTAEELTEYVLQEYPFLAEFFETKANA